MGPIMSNRVVAALMSATAISLFLTTPCLAKSHKATAARKTTQHAATTTHRHASHRRYSSSHVSGLVPPPPAYMPCVLPELYYHGTGSGITEITSEEKKENPYAQYVKNTNGDSPEAMSSRKGVVTWNRRQ